MNFDSGEKPKAQINPLKKAIQLLSRHAYSERELLKKLLDAKIPAAEAAQAVSECRRRGFLNDEILAENAARALVERGSGARRVRLNLAKRGLSDKDVTAAMERVADLELDAARRAMEYKLRLLSRETDSAKKREKVFRFLAGRGFSADVVRKLFDETDFGTAPEDYFEEF